MLISFIIASGDGKMNLIHEKYTNNAYLVIKRCIILDLLADKLMFFIESTSDKKHQQQFQKIGIAECMIKAEICTHEDIYIHNIDSIYNIYIIRNVQQQFVNANFLVLYDSVLLATFNFKSNNIISKNDLTTILIPKILVYIRYWYWAKYLTGKDIISEDTIKTTGLLNSIIESKMILDNLGRQAVGEELLSNIEDVLQNFEATLKKYPVVIHKTFTKTYRQKFDAQNEKSK